MARVYADLCEKGLKNFFKVPPQLADATADIIEADGYVINEDGTVTRA